MNKFHTPSTRQMRRPKALALEADAETIQLQVYEVGKRHDFDDLRDWFKSLYGGDETTKLIGRALAGEDLAA